MSKISDMLAAAGARAETVSPFTRELLLSLESRVAALETRSAADEASRVAKAKADLAEEPAPAAKS